MGFSVFFVLYAYFFLRCVVFVLPSFIHAESVHEFALLACCYLQRSCPSDYIRHMHHAFIIIFGTIHTGCCYGHTPRLSRSPLHGTSFGWFVFLSSHPIPVHSISCQYPSSRRGRQISLSVSLRARARLM